MAEEQAYPITSCRVHLAVKKRYGGLGRVRKVPGATFDRYYEPDPKRLFNPRSFRLPHTYYRSKRTGAQYMVLMVTLKED